MVGSLVAPGVNAYLAIDPPLPMEHQLLGISEIEEWVPADVMIWPQLMALDLGANVKSEVRGV